MMSVSKVGLRMVVFLVLVLAPSLLMLAEPSAASLPASEAGALAELLLQWPSLAVTNNWTQGDEAEACTWPGIFCQQRGGETVLGLYVHMTCPLALLLRPKIAPAFCSLPWSCIDSMASDTCESRIANLCSL